jgi:dephospho-CoA kinase
MTYPVRKLAICGKIRSGKSTVAEYIAEKYEFKCFAFADEMKRLLHVLYPQIPGYPKPRRAYQIFGEGLRRLDLPGAPTVWVDYCLRMVNTHVWWHREVDDRGANVLITDLRTKEEYERLLAEGFTIIRVSAPDDVRIGRALEAGDDFTVHDLAHETEQTIDGFAVDCEIINEGTVDDLKAKIDSIMEAIM